MATPRVTIDALPGAAFPLAAGDLVVVQQSGVTKKITVEDMGFSLTGGNPGYILPVFLGGSVTLQPEHLGRCLQFDGGAAPISLFVDSTVAIGEGAWVDIIRMGTGTLTIVGVGTTVLRQPAGKFPTLRAQYSVGRLTCASIDAWVLSGDFT